MESQQSLHESLIEIARQCKQSEVNILSTGRLATGKSALINALVGSEVAVEGETLDQETTSVASYKTTVQDIVFNVWDSPGIEAGTINELENLKMIARHVPEVDLVLYCIRMDDVRLRKQDIDTIIHFTRAFGEQVWNNAVFALTFANKVTPARNKEDPLNRRQFFEQRLIKWTGELRKVLKEKANVSLEIVEMIPIAPAGYYCDPSLPDGRQNWLSAFWFVCLDAMKDRARPALLKVNLDRFKALEEVTPEDYHLPIYRQPLVVETIRNSIIPGATGVFGCVIGAVVGGPIGLAVGGTIGAVTGFVAQNVGSFTRRWLGY